MRILHTVASLEARFGGPSRSVPALCEALAQRGHDVHLVSQRLDSACSNPLVPDPNLARTTLLPATWVNTGRYPLTLEYTRHLAALARSRGAELIHDHGLWLQSNAGSSRAALRLGIPYFSSPRGTLTKWALQQQRLRKQVAWMLYQHQALRRSRVLFATSADEAKDFRSAGLRQPIAIVPNGITVGPVRRDARGAERVRTVLFLSRLHPKKGVTDLIEAWSQLRPSGWRLVIAGPDEAGYRAVVERCIEQRGVAGSATLRGEVDEASKSAVYASADLFVLPTYSENFGLVVAEAMAHGLPVITTHGAPWGELCTHNAGWWIEPTIPALVAALRTATSMGDEQRRAMGERGRALIAMRYSWEKVVADTASVYRWVLQGGQAPACVELT